MINISREAKDFSETYNSDWEAEAHAQRGEFLELFPLRNLATITLKNYAIGQNEQKTFCYWVEPGTRKWAIINGATAVKFGVYFGRTKRDAEDRFRYSAKFSQALAPVGAEQAAFNRVKAALFKLVHDGENLLFNEIDKNPLSQMFKAKILSLYFPDSYLAICSADRLQDLAYELGLDTSSPSRIQNEALTFKNSNSDLVSWSSLKFAAFLYYKVIQGGKLAASTSKKKRKVKNHREVDFDKLMKAWRELGEQSEKYALAFEKRRLRSEGMLSLVGKISDRTKRPGYGYDFESFSNPNQKRCIEVKTLTNVNDFEARFFISENERRTSVGKNIKSHYYFYLVIYDAKRQPVDVRVVNASQLYATATLDPQNYQVKICR